VTRKRNHRMSLRARESGLHALRYSQPTPPAEVSRIMVLIRLSYEKLKIGSGTGQDYDRVGAAMNVGLIRAESIGQALVDAFLAAGQAMLECSRIHQRHGKFGFTGPHLLTMNAAMDLYEETLAMSSPNQMDAAAQEGADRIRRGEFITA
jgi:hypothetical protein